MNNPCILLLLLISITYADPFIGYVVPASASRGSTVRLLVGGQDLKRNGGLYTGMVTRGGIKFKSIAIVPVFPNAERSQKKWLLQWLATPSKRPPVTDDTTRWNSHPYWETIDKLPELERLLVLKDLYMTGSERKATPSIREMAIVEIEVSPFAKKGLRELRLVGGNGVSNPRLFYVDDRPHFSDTFFVPPDEPYPAPVNVSAIPCVLDGRLLQEEKDQYSFNLKAGKAYSFAMLARVLQPFIGDAVPGYFQGTLRLIDAQGVEVAFADEVYFNPDPVLNYTPQKSGTFTLEINDNCYRGREDFVYRIIVEEGRVGYTVDAQYAALKSGKGKLFSGCIHDSGVTNVHAFSGVNGDSAVIRVIARAAGSPLDPVIKVFAPDGKMIGEADDTIPPIHVGLTMQYFDPVIKLDLPQTGLYKIEITDRQYFGGKDYHYWIQAGAAEPDFSVYSERSGVNFQPKNKIAQVKVYCTRIDGFEDSITLFTKDPDFKVEGNIARHMNEGVMKITRLNNVKIDPQKVKIVARALLNGTTVEKEILPADQWDQAFAYKHLVPSKEFVIGTVRKNRQSNQHRNKTKKAVRD